MNSITSTPGVLRLFAISIVARAPVTMLSIGLLVHAQHLTGSFAAAGLVTGTYALSLGTGGPVLGALVDRHGQTVVLVASAGASAVLLATTALMPVGAPVLALIALAAGIGLATPPLGACVRTLLPTLLRDPAPAQAAYAVDASASELTWISGPPLVLGLGAAWSTGGALAAAGGILLLGTAAFAAEPASRTWRPAPLVGRKPGGSLRTPAMRTLVLVLIAVGVLFGAVEVAVAAAAKGLDGPASTGPLLGLWGLGSLIGGLVAARLGGMAQGTRGFVLVLTALTAGHLSLVAAAGSILALGGALLVAGLAIAPAYAAVYAMVDRAAPPGTLTEAFAWIATAIAIGSAAGAAIAGATADYAGPVAAFALAGGAGATALAVTVLRAHTLPRSEAAGTPTILAEHDGQIWCDAAAA